MYDGRTDRPGRRVVILSRDFRPAELPGLPEQMEYVHVGSAYEAAAELLAAPTAGLVIDLDALGSRPPRLVALARERGIELFGIGSMPAGLSASDLGGMRLVSPEMLGALLAPLTQAPQPTAAPAPPAEVPATGVRLAPAKQRPTDSTHKQPTDGLLSSEELSALLGDRP